MNKGTHRHADNCPDAHRRGLSMSLPMSLRPNRPHRCRVMISVSCKGADLRWRHRSPAGRTANVGPENSKSTRGRLRVAYRKDIYTNHEHLFSKPKSDIRTKPKTIIPLSLGAALGCAAYEDSGPRAGRHEKFAWNGKCACVSVDVRPAQSPS